MQEVFGQEDPLEEDAATHSLSCLENPVDRGAWWALVHREAKRLKRLKRPGIAHMHKHQFISLLHLKNASFSLTHYCNDMITSNKIKNNFLISHTA